MKTVEKICSTCGKEFQTNNDSDLCHNCTLDDVTGGYPPEEGDFNTAAIRSGTLTSQEWRQLQSDLRRVELGASWLSDFSLTEVCDPDEDYYEEDDDWHDDWPEEAKLYAGCLAQDCGWWSSTFYRLDDPGDLECAKKNLIQKHAEECPNCQGKISFG